MISSSLARRRHELDERGGDLAVAGVGRADDLATFHPRVGRR